MRSSFSTGLIAATLLFLLLGTARPGFAQRDPTEKLTRLLVIFDGSRSMYARWEKQQKIVLAKGLMRNLLDSLQSLDNPKLELALRVYGHQSPVPPQDCEDSKLEIPFSKNNYVKIKSFIHSLAPKGTTPLAYSLKEAAQDFPPCNNCRNVILLITDGIEACEGDPCEAALALQKEGIALRPFVLGINVSDTLNNRLDCIGEYYDIQKPGNFGRTLQVVIRHILDPTTVQINLLDQRGLPRETNLAMSFYNALTGKVERQMVHTLNHKGNPDTLYLDPLIRYNLTVHSKPEKKRKDIKLSPGRHNIIGVDLPRGFLRFKSSGLSKYQDLKALIYPPDETAILNQQDPKEKVRYRSGPYQLKILTLPPIHIPRVEIRPGETTEVTIPPPGTINFVSGVPGFGSILQRRQNGPSEWVTDLETRKSRQSITLQPGKYTVIFRPRTAGSSRFSVVRQFEIKSGSNTTINLK
jgi:Ca-activated chloride channel family protein